MPSATYRAVQMDDNLQAIPSDQIYGGEPASDVSRRHTFSTKDFLVDCVIPPLMGFSFVALGFYIVYTPTAVVVSHSTEHAAVISQAFTAIFAVWHFLAIIPVLSAVQRVRSEEWWRRLLHTTSFNRVNSVSSNIGGTVSHTIELLVSWSSHYFKSAWMTALIAIILADVAPGAIHIEVGLSATSASFPVPALPADSVYSNYSEPLIATHDQVHASIDIAPVYYNAIMFAGMYVTTAPPALNALVPRPNVSPGQGYRYLTDVAFLEYNCDWYAPVLAEPDSMTDILSQTLTITVGGIQGIGYAPLWANDVYPLVEYVDPSTSKPSFDGYATFVVTSGDPFPGGGYFDLSSVPTYHLSASWQTVTSTFVANQTVAFMPVKAISVAVCSPKYHIEPWTVELINGTTTLVEFQQHSVGNLDPTQLQIAIQDCFNHLPAALPLDSRYGLSIALVTTLFNLSSNNTPPSASPQSSEELSLAMNQFAIPTSVQAYLDDFPFGSFTPSDSKLLVPALVLSAQFDFICATAALYALLSVALFYIFHRPFAQPFTIQNVLSATQEVTMTSTHTLSCGQDVAAKIKQIAVVEPDIHDSATEARINKTIGDHYTMIREDLTIRRPILELDSNPHPVASNQLLQRYEIMRTRRSRTAWIVTPIFGAALVAFGITTWRRPYVSSMSPHDKRATLFSALFTWAIGLWRSVSLLPISALIRQANSDEWSRIIKTHRQSGITGKLRAVLNDVSTNTLSFLGSFRAAWMTRTSAIFKICYVATLLVSLCAVMAQGTVTLLTLPVQTNKELTIPLLARSTPIPVPWSADATLAPLNAGIIELGQLGTSWTYLEQIVGASVADTMPPGYLVPLLTQTNNTIGSQYPTDVAHIQCKCTWVAPTLPAATANVSYIPVSLEKFGIAAVQTVPHGAASFAALANMTYLSNSTAVTSGLFAWTLWGGGPGDPVNLESVSHANVSTAWQKLIADEIAPAYIKSFPGDAPYITNLTRVSTLVCDPRIQIMPKLARAFGGFVQLADAPVEYSLGVGNIDKDYVSWMVYNYAVQQSRDFVGRFRPYLFFGVATGNATLDSDPNNPVNGTVPKPTTEIAHLLDAYIGSASKSWITTGLSANHTTVNGQIIEQSLVITAAPLQVFVAGGLYLLLALAALVIRFRIPGAPFTLAGVLMMHSELAALNMVDRKEPKDDGIDEREFGKGSS